MKSWGIEEKIKIKKIIIWSLSILLHHTQNKSHCICLIEDRLDARMGTSTQNTPYALLMLINKPLPTCYIITGSPQRWPAIHHAVAVCFSCIPHIHAYSLPRYHHSADHDHPEHGGQELATQSVLRDGHGPVCHRLLPVRLRRHDRVRHAQLLLLQRAQTPAQDAENGKPAVDMWVMHLPFMLNVHLHYSRAAPLSTSCTKQPVKHLSSVSFIYCSQ